MIGLGKWSFNMDLPFIQVNPTVIIADNNGQYAITASLGTVSAEPATQILDVQESGNSLIFKMSYPLFNVAGDIHAVLTFDGNTCKGTAEIPMLGKISVLGTREG